MLQTIIAFLGALAVGNATFTFWAKGKKFHVTLVNNGKPQGPNLKAAAQLANAAFSAALSGAGSVDIRVGADNWTVTVTAA